MGVLDIIVNNELIANQDIEFRFVVISDNNKESLEVTYSATIGSIADYDCNDYDEDDYFVF